jgi:uncharacterized membrane protein YeaQ/YmgE (transglycosylase-associated protein family)
MLIADSWLGWIAIGAAAGLAGMLWPFQRGALGVVVNFVAGVAGAIVAALLSFLVLPGAHDVPARLAFAAVGALGALGLVHALWVRHTGDGRRAA